MISLLESRQRLLGLVIVMLMLVGIMAYFNMARQEDPSFPYRAGLISVSYPGASAEAVERLVIRPLEEQLLQVEELDNLNTTARNGIAVLTVMMGDHIYDTDAAWERIRQAMERAELEFPEGVGRMSLDDRLIDTPIVVLALGGSDSLLTLSRQAKNLKDQLLGLPGLSRIQLEAVVDEQITLAVDDATLHQLGLSTGQLVNQIARRNQVIPSGFVVTQGQRQSLLVNTEFENLDDLATTQIQLPDGSYLPLTAIADIRLGPQEPGQAQAWFDGEPVVLLSLYARRGQVDAIKFGQALRERVALLAPDYAPLSIHEMFFQPDMVRERLDDLEGSLLLSVTIITLVVFVAMGLRMGLLVASMLPVVALISLGLYNMGGGILHQIAVIGLVISLGILIDNGIVMVENLQARLAAGEQRRQAVRDAVRELIGPLGASTATTLAAFTPLLLSRGGTADFTRGIPVMIMLALTISYLLSISLAPLLAARFLRRNDASRSKSMVVLGKYLGELTTRRPRQVLLAGVAVVAFSFLLTPFMAVQFFPNADRPLVLLDVYMPDGTDHQQTVFAAEQLEVAMRQHPAVVKVHRFTGFNGPTFFYNLLSATESPHRARLVITATELEVTDSIMQMARAHVQQKMPEMVLSAFLLGQGPPRDAPVEVRVFHPDDNERMRATEQIHDLLRQVPGSIDVRHNLDPGIPRLRIEVDDALAARAGVARDDVGRALFAQSYGIRAEFYRQERDPIPMVVRSPDGHFTSLEKLLTTHIYTQTGEPVPLMQIARLRADWEPAGIQRRNGERLFVVSANLQGGFSFSQILDGLDRLLEASPLPEGTRIEYGGDSQGSGDANRALAHAAPIGVLLLLFFLVLQFNSYRRVAIVLLTVPMAAVGIIPGLVISGAPFGFMSLLGVVALVGIVVNNAIVLIAVIDWQLKAGMKVSDAVHYAVSRRTRPILLTTATTVAGLLPLAFTTSTLWPPMAWAIISGLLASTVLTLLVVPALCALTLRQPSHMP